MLANSNAMVLGIFFCLSTVIVRKISGDCVFNVVNNKTEKNQPVPLYNISSDYEFAVPHQGLIRLKEGQNISLLCSGNRNYVIQTNSNVTTVTCIENDDVKLYRKTYKFEEILCKHLVKGDMLATKQKCGNKQGLVYLIGYPITRKDWITLIEVCFASETGNVLFTEHTLYGEEVKYASRNKYRPAFNIAGHHASVSLTYKQVYQKAQFASILGSALLAGHYINDKSFLARGHLSPDADFLLATAQFSTYFYINTAPQWQVINTASWKSIESTVRKLASYYGNLKVFTGTHGILRYSDKDGVPHEIYLGTNATLPVPKYFWKIAYEPKSEKAIVFVILNDPFVKSARDEIFCDDICNENGFTKRSWKDPATGLVFCCDLKDFRNTVATAPKIRVSDVLSVDETSPRNNAIEE